MCKCPTSRNYKPKDMMVGDCAFLVNDGSKVKILDSVFSKNFESGHGYLVVVKNEPKWIDSTFFWSEAEVKALVEESKW